MCCHSKKDREKVLREVKALAKISASASSVLLRRVVRYYTSWNDQLPPGWTGMDLWKGLKSTETYTLATLLLFYVVVIIFF